MSYSTDSHGADPTLSTRAETVAPGSYHVLQITAEQARPLRHAVLRPHQTLAHCVYQGDEEAWSAHFGVVVEDEIVGVASIYNQNEEDIRDPFSWRLRGMATREDLRRRGYGLALIEACVRYATNQGGLRLWCNARTTAAGFYHRAGFQTLGEEFDLPGLGPHQVLERSL